ncbi:MAG: DUF2267 domain-containing protein [Nannocystaceae bacterium]
MRFETYATFANAFVAEYAGEIGVGDDLRLATRALRALVGGLRSGLSRRASTRLMRQLPLLIKALYVDGWDFDEREAADEGRLAAFVAAPLPLPIELRGGEAIAALFAVLRRHAAAAEFQELRGSLPTDLLGLMPATS